MENSYMYSIEGRHCYPSSHHL